MLFHFICASIHSAGLGQRRGAMGRFVFPGLGVPTAAIVAVHIVCVSALGAGDPVRPQESENAPPSRNTELVRRLTSSRAYQATARASRANLANEPRYGITPSNLISFRNRIERDGSAWRFRYRGDDAQIVYTWRPADGTLDDLTAQVDGQPSFRPAYQGGAMTRTQRAGKTEEVRLQGGRPMEVERAGDQLRVTWAYTVAERPVLVFWTFGMRGKALTIEAHCDEPVVTRFTLGKLGAPPASRALPIPYLDSKVEYIPDFHLFVMRLLDWTQSHSSSCPLANAVYETKTDGTRNPLFERGYVAVSPDLGEVLPNLPHPASPYRALLAPRIVLDIWSHANGSFAGDAENLRRLKDLGVDHAVALQHAWQCFGYDVKLPDHFPADPRFGGDEGLARFGEAARACDDLWALHENYIDLYPDAPSYDPTARTLKSDGSPMLGWYNGTTKVQSFGLRNSRTLGYARANSPEIHRRYGTTAAYLDVHTCVGPWHRLDHDSAQPLAAMALAKVQSDAELFQFERETHGGPLFGEGGSHFYWAGRCDGVEAQVPRGEDHAPLFDFDLLKIHPQMVNHGMGYLERWFRHGYNHELGIVTGTLEQIDQYRAMELAYGHAGFVPSPHDQNWQWVVREHHLMHPVQSLYGAAQAIEILYEVDGQLVTASVALAAGDTLRTRIRYDSGLTLWVNGRPEPWPVQDRVLPQWGWLALGPKTEASTLLNDGKWADYVSCPEYVFADARTFFHAPYRRERKSIEPRLRDFRHLGGNRVQVTYEWTVGEALDQDYQCFVHGVDPQTGPGPEFILFQQGHRLPKPTLQWRPGDVLVDGPYTIEIPDRVEQCDLSIGLYKGPRLRLKGLSDSNHRVVIGRLKRRVAADGSQEILAEKPSQALMPRKVPDSDFAAHLNPPGTWVDFGPVATDGALKIRPTNRGLMVWPYPRDQAFSARLDLEAWTRRPQLDRLQVRLLAVGDERDLGPADFRVEGTRLHLRFGQPGVGRHLITWGG